MSIISPLISLAVSEVRHRFRQISNEDAQMTAQSDKDLHGQNLRDTRKLAVANDESAEYADDESELPSTEDLSASTSTESVRKKQRKQSGQSKKHRHHPHHHHHHQRRQRISRQREIQVMRDGVKVEYSDRVAIKWVESGLIVGLLSRAAFHNWATVIDNIEFLALCSVIISAALILQPNKWIMPSVLYVYLFPSALTLADYPEYLHLNMLLAVCSLPIDGVLLSCIVMALAPNKPEIYFLHACFNSIVGDLTTTSLSSTETTLAATLLVNLFLNAQTPAMMCLRAFIFGGALSLWPAMPLIRRIMAVAKIPRYRRTRRAVLERRAYSVAVYLVFVLNVAVIVRPYLAKDLGGKDPLIWLLETLLLEGHASRTRLGMLLYWSIWMAVGITWIQRTADSWTLDMRRKVWHGMVVGMFLVGGVGWDAEFTALALAVALTGFLLAEFVRATTLPPFGPMLQEALRKYTDERDSCGPVVVSHVFLLLGISLPIFWAGSPAGIVCLGFGDACASIIGRRYGRMRWFDSRKTVEGSLAFVVAASIGLGLSRIAISGSQSLTQPITAPMNGDMGSWTSMIIAATATAVLEATSGMNDNVIVPVYMYVALRVCAGGTMDRVIQQVL
ncbi:uncharacterized protein V1516DRAFT_544870 [Lipomyces oligophaga]|uniref:uncharacterized protein n=1 Tax=Lipomyces oligophaga TaxID=45792 RepID=UPI0034CD0D7C